MTVAKMSVTELEKFLHDEFPQAFKGGDITIESADGASCLLRQRYSDQMLRPGGTVSGPTLMALADCAMYVVLLVGDRPGRPRGHHKSQHQFSSQGRGGAGRAGGRDDLETRQAVGGRRGQSVVGHVARSDRPCDRDLFHSKYISFCTVTLHHIYKPLLLLELFTSKSIDGRARLI